MRFSIFKNALFIVMALGIGTQGSFAGTISITGDIEEDQISIDAGSSNSASTNLMKTSDPDTMLANAAKKYANAIGLIVVQTSEGDFPFGTAWAISESTFITTARITEYIKELLPLGVNVYVTLNKRNHEYFTVYDAVSHPKHGETPLNSNGMEGLPSSDLGMLRIEGKTNVTMPLPHRAELKKLDSGYRVAYLGFPSVGLVNDNLNVYSPIATMQSGIITSVSDFWQGDSGFERNRLIRHNMGGAPGVSGSPIFNVHGEVVGVFTTGNTAVSLQIVNGEVVFDSSPSAAMINYGQRIDSLVGLYELFN